MKIPIQNIYYMLAYSWNCLREKDIVYLETIDFKDLYDLLSKIFLRELSILFKKGLERNYQTIYGESDFIKGKICFEESLNKNLFKLGKVYCEYDELAIDTLNNQILKATINFLIKNNETDRNHKIGFKKILKRMKFVKDINLIKKHFFKSNLNPNNKHYRLCLNICGLIYDNSLVDEKSGKVKFKDFYQDEKKMWRLFQNFIKNFYRKEQSRFKVSSKKYKFGKLVPKNEQSRELRPGLETDIVLESEDKLIIIDTKFYKDMLHKRFNTKKFNREHLSQIIGYFQNIQFAQGIDLDVPHKEAILMYPLVRDDAKGDFRYDDFDVIIRTINLNQSWKHISESLKTFIE